MRDLPLVVRLIIVSISSFALPLDSLAAETQGVYLDRLTVDTSTHPVAYVSTGNATEELLVTNYMTGEVVFHQNIIASEQTNGASPWINAEWSRSETLPKFPPGLYFVHVDSAAVTPSLVDRGQNTYEMPLFVVPTNPSADVLFVFSSLTSTCYNEWGGKSCYTKPSQPDVGFKRPGVYKAHIGALRRIAKRADALDIDWDAVDEQWVEDNSSFLQNYRAVILVLQPEYATLAMRDNYENYMNSGGRLAILGNEAWIYQVRRDGDTYSVYKAPEAIVDPYDSDGDPSNDHLIAYEWVRGTPVSNTTGPNRPETRILGQSTWLGYDAANPYWTAWRTEHWLYDGTELLEGGHFRDGLSGGDPIPLSMILGGVKTAWWGGWPYAADRDTYEVPDNVLVLATIPSPNSRPWDCEPYWNAKDSNCRGEGTAAITIRETENGGVALVVPDHQWPFAVLADSVATQITDNILTVFADSDPVDVYDGYSPWMSSVAPALSERMNALAAALLALVGILVLSPVGASAQNCFFKQRVRLLRSFTKK